MSENPLIASDLLLDGQVIRYDRYFEKFKSSRHKYWFKLINVKSRATN